MIGEKSIVQLVYDEELNIFTDVRGHVIYNPFEFITPDDLQLFRSEETSYSSFVSHSDPNVLCEIYTWDEIGDGYFDTRKGCYDEQIYSGAYCSISGGWDCRFSSESEDARRDICAACGG